jgi:hypothetical protein
MSSLVALLRLIDQQHFFRSSIQEFFMREFIVRITAQPTRSRFQVALASALLATALSSPAFAQGQPAPQLAPLQPKVPLQPQLPTDRKPITIEGDKLISPMSPRIPPTPVAKKPDIALERITLPEAYKMANNETKVSFRVHAKNVGNSTIANASVHCGAGSSATSQANRDFYRESTWLKRALVPHTQLSSPGDTHVIAFEIMLHSTYVTANKWGFIVCDLFPNQTSDDINPHNDRVTSILRFPDGPALNFPLLPR